MPALGDPQAEVVRRPAHRLLRLDRTPLPQLARGCGAARSGTPRPAAASECTPKAKLRVRTPRWATCRIRSVGSGSIPSASTTSSVCAQVSMNRAVPIEVGLIGGPNHGIFWPVGETAQRLLQRRARRRHRSSRLGRVGLRTLERLLRRRSLQGPRWRARHELVPRLLVGRRDDGDLVGPGEVCDLGGDGPSRLLGSAYARPRRRAVPASPRARRPRRRGRRAPGRVGRS